MTSHTPFAELYRTHYRRVFGLCRQLLGSSARAEDAASEVFMRAYQSFASYDPQQPFAGWILKITSNHCIDLIRRGARRAGALGTEADERLAAESESEDSSALGALVAAERAREVNAAVAALPERYRLPLVLAYYRDASYEEIAAELGITRSHVGALICRAKQVLRRTLAASGEENRS